MIPSCKVYRRTLSASACVLAATLSLGGAQAASAYSVIYNFAGFANGGQDGSSPVAEVTFDKAGNLYGTTPYGGTSNTGTVFSIAANGTYTVLHSFTGDDSQTGGNQPNGGVTVSSSGDLTGTTSFGGTTNYGTAWLLKSGGAYSVQHNFDVDEDFPYGTPLSASKATYGVTLYGDPDGTGTIWKLTKKGFSVIHGFTFAGNEAAYPNGGLVQDSDGNLYGTASQGGTSACSCGAVFRIAPDGSGYTTLYSFTGGADGDFPLGALVRDTDGTLYGTASETLFSYGCDTNSCGTLWQLKPNGEFTVLHTFAGGNDGANPAGNVLKIGKSIYGTTQYGGGSGCSSHGCGTVYKLSVGTKVKYKVLHKFAEGTSDGQRPLAGLAQGAKGKLYGTTYVGGQYNGGTVFALSTK
jgi:uncharacterized repeat protein (TIGR03803 family)